ncbi:2-octaprenyl-6-methoxyphenyl hydroxylase [Pseudaeromonas paramecii]|uniref:2-octaprenyl-6-methoxyphenyl hydroxylase n=1 Tax=Pseudaeromonas paramecii TaxID=2138166 RepID=A0ABP8Q1X1_9GAMM
MPACDVAIVGGGMVGATLALALSQLRRPDGQPLDIVLLEANSPGQAIHPGFDARAIALSYGSCELLQGWGLWTSLAPTACAIEQIHVSDSGHFGRVKLTAQEYRLPWLGQVVELATTGSQLYEALAQRGNVRLRCPAHLVDVSPSEREIALKLDDGSTWQAELALGADGADSLLRQQLRLPCEQYDFGQTAIITTLQTDLPPAGRAWERFTAQGPLALLPLSESRYSVVWCQAPDEAQQSLLLDDAAFLSRLQQAFGYRAGRFVRLGQRHAYPLTGRQVTWPLGPHALVLGNAAHLLHPVAGQGFNLGMRDIAVLQEELARALADGESIGSYRVLRRYWQRRQPDQRQLAWMTGSLARLFANEVGPLVLGRNLLLATMNRCDDFKLALTRRALGKEWV